MDAKDILKFLDKKKKKFTGWADKKVTRLSDVAQILNSLSEGAEYTTSI